MSKVLRDPVLRFGWELRVRAQAMRVPESVNLTLRFKDDARGDEVRVELAESPRNVSLRISAPRISIHGSQGSISAQPCEAMGRLG